MKLFVKLMILALIIAVAGPMFIKGPDGEPLIAVEDLNPSIAGFTGVSKDTFGNNLLKNNPLKSGKTKVYKWKDQNGVWQISDQPPAGAEATNNPDTTNSPNSTSNPNTSGAFGFDASNRITTAKTTTTKTTTASIQVQEIVIDSNTNVVKSLPQNQIDQALGRAPKTTPTATPDKSENNNSGLLGGAEKLGPSLTTIPMDNISQLIKDAKAAKALIESRKAELDKNMQRY